MQILEAKNLEPQNVYMQVSLKDDRKKEKLLRLTLNIRVILEVEKILY